MRGILAVSSIFIFIMSGCFKTNRDKTNEILELREEIANGITVERENQLIEYFILLASSEGEYYGIRGGALNGIGDILEKQQKEGRLNVKLLKEVHSYVKYPDLILPVFYVLSRVPLDEIDVIDNSIDLLFAIENFDDGNKASLVSEIVVFLLKSRLLTTHDKTKIIGEYFELIAKPKSERFIDRGKIYFFMYHKYPLKGNFAENLIGALQYDAMNSNDSIKALASKILFSIEKAK